MGQGRDDLSLHRDAVVVDFAVEGLAQRDDAFARFGFLEVGVWGRDVG